MFSSDQDQWDPQGDKQKQLMGFLSNNFQTPSGKTSPPAVSGLPPAPPSDSKITTSQEEPLSNAGQEAGENEEGENTEAVDQGIEEKTIDSHPGQPDALTPYLKEQEANVDKWGPDKQAALMQNLQQGYKSPGNVLAKGGATVADAIMQGVARAGSSGNLAAINERENQNLNRAQEMGKNLNEANMQGIKTKMGMEELSPATPLGSANEPAIQAVASMYGMKPEQVNALMKSNPRTALSLLDKVGEFATGQAKVEIEQKIKMLELEMQNEQRKATNAIAQEGRDIEAKKERRDTLKEVSDHSILHPINAWKASKDLANDAGGSSFSPDVVAYASRHGIAPAQAQEQKNRRTSGKS